MEYEVLSEVNKCHDPVHLIVHSSELIHRSLEDLGRNVMLEDWQMMQVIN